MRFVFFFLLVNILTHFFHSILLLLSIFQSSGPFIGILEVESSEKIIFTVLL